MNDGKTTNKFTKISGIAAAVSALAAVGTLTHMAEVGKPIALHISGSGASGFHPSGSGVADSFVSAEWLAAAIVVVEIVFALLALALGAFHKKLKVGAWIPPTAIFNICTAYVCSLSAILCWTTQNLSDGKLSGGAWVVFMLAMFLNSLLLVAVVLYIPCDIFASILESAESRHAKSEEE